MGNSELEHWEEGLLAVVVVTLMKHHLKEEESASGACGVERRPRSLLSKLAGFAKRLLSWGTVQGTGQQLCAESRESSAEIVCLLQACATPKLQRCLGVRKSWCSGVGLYMGGSEKWVLTCRPAVGLEVMEEGRAIKSGHRDCG